MEKEPSRIAVVELLERHLTQDDDPQLWAAVVETVYSDAEYLCSLNSTSATISTTIGCCSHWLRPHQTRWTADGGFAWPTGYGGREFSRTGLPLHDWEVELWWNAEGRWEPKPPPGLHPRRVNLQLRVSVPARSTRHEQAAVFTIWMPGSPPLPQKQLLQFYGFRRQETGWLCTAVTDRRTAYEHVGKA